MRGVGTCRGVYPSRQTLLRERSTGVEIAGIPGTRSLAIITPGETVHFIQETGAKAVESKHTVTSLIWPTLDKDGNLWFAEYVEKGQIGKVDAKSLKVTKWKIPTADGRPRRIQIDPEGVVWFAEFKSGKIGRFDPKTETMKEFTLPGPEATPYALGLDRNGMVWYSSEHMDVVGALNPKTGRVTEYPYPHSENTMREFFADREGRMWFGSPANNKVGYFYLAGAAK